MGSIVAVYVCGMPVAFVFAMIGADTGDLDGREALAFCVLWPIFLVKNIFTGAISLWQK